MKPRRRAWEPPGYTVADIYAMKALANGTASDAEQKRALGWIVDFAADLAGGTAFRSDGEGGARETDFALGRQFVGTQIQKLVNMPPAQMDEVKRYERRTGNHRTE